MTVKEVLGCICFALAAGAFVRMYLIPVIRRRRKIWYAKGHPED